MGTQYFIWEIYIDVTITNIDLTITIISISINLPGLPLPSIQLFLLSQTQQSFNTIGTYDYYRDLHLT